MERNQEIDALKKEIADLKEFQNQRSKHFLSELDRVERKIDRTSKDVWKMVSDIIKVLEGKSKK